MNFDLPTKPDGDFYSIPEINELLTRVIDKITETISETISKEGYKITAKELERGADLNDVVEGGHYAATSTELAATLLNLPEGLTGGFHLLVLPISSAGGLAQVIFSGRYIYTRRKSTASYAEWYKHTGELPTN